MIEEVLPLELSPLEFRNKCDAGELWQLLDVRESWEIELASLENSVNIPLAEIPSRIVELDDAKPIAVLCHAGVRSATAANFLAQQGFVRVANITGGIDAWSVSVDSTVPRY
jgi:rhodanese-related sulfurtransferase